MCSAKTQSGGIRTFGPSSTAGNSERREYSDSKLAASVVATVITSNTALAAMPGNVFLPSAVSGLPRDSVVNVTAVLTLNTSDLDEKCGQISDGILDGVDVGLRLVFEL